jgi:type II secretory pathway pseudopilin PulG
MTGSASNRTMPKTAENGFSLLEVLVAACVLAGSISALAQIFVFATRAHAEAQYATYATVLATQKMEELRSTALSADVIDAIDYADLRGAVLPEGADTFRGVYERHWTVEPLPTTLDALVITVTVARGDAALRGGGVRLVTLQRPRRPDTDGLEATGE